ncbi:MAG: hypothetical protein IJU28_04870 [Clostridia bacterium]|nr:hypothetical protein [Clostridia bacterium]
MIPHTGWAWSPYAPLLRNVGDIYICRVAPEKDSIHIEWLPMEEGAQEYHLFLAPRGEELRPAGVTRACVYDFTGLTPGQDYCFQVTNADKKSLVRLARCGLREGGGGVTVNYLHPDDEAYSFSGRYLCSPSIVRAPQGHLLTSMDLFAPNAPQNLTLIFRSDDEGKSWHYVSELYPCFWGKLFVHRERLYMLGVSTEYGDLLIGASDDGGYTFTPPTVLWRGACHSGEDGIHKNPQPVVEYAHRLWNTCEWGCWAHGTHAAMVFSCDVDDDLLDASAWRFTPPVPYDPSWPGTAEGRSCGTIEGTLTVLPDGGLYNVMRYDMTRCKPDFGLVLAFRVNADDPDAPLSYSHAISLSGNHSKFEIKYDGVSGCYYSIISRIRASENRYDRNLLSLMVSRDAENWHLACDLIDATDSDPKQVGFQYVDFMFDGNDLLYLTRTAANGAHNFHDANSSVFDRVKDFRRFADKA